MTIEVGFRHTVKIPGGAYYWKEFWVSKWDGLDDKNS